MTTSGIQDFSGHTLPGTPDVAKGSLIVGSGNGVFSCLPVGSVGSTLSVDPSQSAGVRWVPSGGTPLGVPIVRKFPFAYNTPGILTGAALYTPTVGDILLDAWIEIDTAWNGTTPGSDVGQFIDQHVGWFGMMTGFSGGVGMRAADAMINSTEPTLIGASWSGPLSSLQAISMPTATYDDLYTVVGANLNLKSNALGSSIGNRLVPFKFLTTDSVKVCGQNGQNNGADPGSTQGAGVLYLVTVTPV